MSDLIPVDSPSLQPLQQSFERDQLESELKAVFLAVFESMIRANERRLNLYGMPHLGDAELVERALKDSGLANALLPTDTQPGLSATLTHVAIGTGLYDPVVDANGRATQTALVNEVARYAISSGSKPDNYSVQIGTTITDTDMNGASPNGKSIGEIGFYAGTTLFAVWSRATGGALFVKSENLDVPFAYTLDVSVLPVGSVNITVSTDTAGMAALILQHEAKLDPHPGYVLKKRGMGEYDPLTIYNAGAHIVGPDGKTYRSLVDNNVGNTPASYPVKWERWAFSTGELAAEFVPVRTGVQANGSNTLGMVRITNPDAAYFASDSNPLTGAFKIVLPTGAYNALVRMRVEIHESATGKSITLLIAGYASGINWSNQTVAILGERADRDLAVRFGNDGSKPIVWIGELTSTWSFPRVYVSEVMVSYNADGGSVARWMAGWSISAVTAFNAVTATMTGNLVFGQSDIPRVAGLQAALDLKAPLDSAQMTGTPSITNTPTATTAQLALKGASGALNNEGKLRLYGTFGTGSSDTGTRLIASLRAGFNAGSWGKEYLNFWINNGSSNDGQSDASQQLVMSLVSGGRVLVNASSDDGSTALQVNGSVRAANYNINSQSVGDSGIFGFANANGPAVAAYGSDTLGAGALVLRTAGAERARVSAAGRLLIGTTTDDGANPVQVYSQSGDGKGFLSIAGGNTTGMGGAISFAANVGSAPMSQIKGVLDNRYSGGGYDQGGLAFLTRPAGNSAAGTLTERMRITNPGRVLIGTTSDDGSSLLQVAGNTYFYGVSYFGQTSAKAWINADADAYYLYGQGNALVGSAGSSGYLGLVSANAERLRVTASGRILIGTTADNGGDLLQVAGTVRGINGVGALIAANGGGTGQTSIILSRDGGPADQKNWEVMHGGDGTFAIRTVNDAYSAAQNALWVTRGTGSTVGNMVLLQNGGRVLVGTLADDGANMLQVAGTGMFANNVSAYSSANDTQFTLSASNYAGGISLEAYNKANTTKKNIALAPWGGRVQVGSIPDDESSLLQVGGNGRFSGEVQSTSGIQLRAVFGSYGSMLRNDGTNVYLLQTASGDQYGTWNAFRPFQWNLSSGAVTVDQTGLGTTFGGNATFVGSNVTINRNNGEGRVMVGQNDGYFYGNANQAGWYSPTKGSWNFNFDARNLQVGTYNVWHAGNVTPLDKNVGGTVTGNVAFNGQVTMSAGLATIASGTTYSALAISANGYTPRIQTAQASSMIGFVNGANTAYNLQVFDGGNVTTRDWIGVGGSAYASGTNATIAPDGNIWGTQWGNQWLRSFLDATYVHKSGDTMTGRLTLANGSWQADIGLAAGDGWSTYLRARKGGGIELINSAYNSVPAFFEDNGNLHIGSSTFQTDGNIWMGWYGGYLSAALGSKANAGSRVQWDSGVNNFGTVDKLGGAIPAPWVVCGLSGPGNGTANAIVVYGVLLRNQ